MAKKRRAGAGPLQTAEPSETQKGLLQDAGIFAILAVAVFAAYWPALRGGILWDDAEHITKAALQSWHGLWRIWFDVGATQQYYPLLHSAFWLEHRLWGDAVLGYHLTNVVLHAACCCLVILIMKRLALPGAWLAGLIFALHPVNAESVAWISEQKNTLSGVFYLGSALVYLRFDEQRRWRDYFLAAGLFVAAVLSKTVTATLPAVLLVVIWWRRGKFDWRRDAVPAAPWLAFGAAAGIFTSWVERTMIGANGADFTMSLGARCLLAGRVIWFYASKLVWPSDLSFIYPRWQVDAGEAWQYLYPAGVAAVAAVLVLWTRRSRGPLAGFLVFVGTLAPVLGFLNVFPFIYSFVADHFQYLASLGIIIPVSAAVAEVAQRPRYQKRGAGIVLAALVTGLGVLTCIQAGKYRDSETLYKDTVERNPGSWMAHNSLGNALIGKPERIADMIAEYRTAVDIKPDYWEAQTNLGNVLMQSGEMADAAGAFRAALKTKPDLAEAHYGLANTLARTGHVEEAIAEYRAALRSKPDMEDAHLNLGNALSQNPSRLPEAVAEYQAALKLEPDMAEAHYALGNAWSLMRGHLTDAVAEYQAAVRIQPDYWEAHTNLGNALARIGRMEEAIAAYRAALKINPSFAETHANLGSILAQAGHRQEAVAEYEEAVRIKPALAPAAEALRQLGGGK